MSSAAGTVILQDDGQTSLDEDGKELLSDGSSDCDCCPTADDGLCHWACGMMTGAFAGIPIPLLFFCAYKDGGTLTAHTVAIVSGCADPQLVRNVDGSYSITTSSGWVFTSIASYYPPTALADWTITAVPGGVTDSVLISVCCGIDKAIVPSGAAGEQTAFRALFPDTVSIVNWDTLFEFDGAIATPSLPGNRIWAGNFVQLCLERDTYAPVISAGFATLYAGTWVYTDVTASLNYIDCSDPAAVTFVGIVSTVYAANIPSPTNTYVESFGQVTMDHVNAEWVMQVGGISYVKPLCGPTPTPRGQWYFLTDSGAIAAAQIAWPDTLVMV